MVPVPFNRVGEPPMPLTLPVDRWKSLMSLASFIIMRLAPVSIQKDILSVSAIKTIGSDLTESVGVTDDGVDEKLDISLLRCTFLMTVATYFRWRS